MIQDISGIFSFFCFLEMKFYLACMNVCIVRVGVKMVEVWNVDL